MTCSDIVSGVGSSGVYKTEEKEIKGSPCLIEQKINNKIFEIKELYKKLNKIVEENWIPYLYSIRECCNDIWIIKRDVEVLSLILHPEYRYSEIDANSFREFLRGEENLVRVILFNENRNDYAFRYFKPEEK